VINLLRSTQVRQIGVRFDAHVSVRGRENLLKDCANSFFIEHEPIQVKINVNGGHVQVQFKFEFNVGFSIAPLTTMQSEIHT
jgi:hypothetical protein